MCHTFETNSSAYWARVTLVVGLIFAFGLLPLMIPVATDSQRFVLVVNLAGVVSPALLIYVRSRKLTLVIDEHGIVITDRKQRIILSKRFSEVDDLSLGRWGRVLNFSIGWIVLKQTGQSKPEYYGAISAHKLNAETIANVRESFLESKKRNSLDVLDPIFLDHMVSK